MSTRIPLENQRLAQLSLEAQPHPELYHLYFRDDAGARYQLIRDPRAITLKTVRIYADQTQLSYTTLGLPGTTNPKETFVDPRKKKYIGARSYPNKDSYAYPSGVRTYYVKIEGKNIQLDRGHGVPHIDTLPGATINSSSDPENYAPQNWKYNQVIRKWLEGDSRKNGLKYKELSIYHPSSIYSAETSDGKQYDIPVPEGFVFFIFNSEGHVKDSYYFPNFVDYEALKGEDKTYKPLREKYHIQDLSKWILVPQVTAGEPDNRQENTDIARNIASRVQLVGRHLFKKFSETEMPKKARTALSMTLFEWNLEAAATLESLSVINQLELAHFYIKERRKFWEFDDRSEKNQAEALSHFLGDPSLSETIKEIVSFLHENLGFLGMQPKLYDIYTRCIEDFTFSPHCWEAPKLYANQFSISCKERIHRFNLYDISPSDFPRVYQLIGGASHSDETKARYILSIIDERLQRQSSTPIEKLHMIRAYNDFLPDSQKLLEWEQKLSQQLNEETVELIDLRRAADFYSYRSIKEKRDQWLGILYSHVEKYPTSPHFLQIADWCLTGRAAFLQKMSELTDPLRPSYVLALQIYEGLGSNMYKENITFLKQKLGCTPLKDQEGKPFLDAALYGGKPGQVIKQLSILFHRKFNATVPVSKRSHT